MQILKRTGINWRERRLISKLYMDQRVKLRMDRGETRSVQIGRGVRQGCCLSPTLFNALPRKLWMGLETLTSEDNYSNYEICR